jgi:hypothetical protein
VGDRVGHLRIPAIALASIRHFERPLGLTVESWLVEID